MPVFDQHYKAYEGTPWRRFRWLIILEHELRTLAGFRIFKILCLLAAFNVLLRFLQILGTDIIAQDPNHILTPIIKQIHFMKVDVYLFKEFIQLQIPITFITILYAGSSMICNDIRYYLVDVYFSKPITWKDYVIGKVGSLFTIGMCFTFVPVFLLLTVHNLFLPGWENLAQSWTWLWMSFLYTVVISMSLATTVLAASALVNSPGFAAISIFMIAMANSAMAGILAVMLRERDYLILAYPSVLTTIGEQIFQRRHGMYQLHWGYSLAMVILVCGVSLIIISTKIRRVGNTS